jgi:hypothetical protein
MCRAYVCVDDAASWPYAQEEDQLLGEPPFDRCSGTRSKVIMPFIMRQSLVLPTAA